MTRRTLVPCISVLVLAMGCAEKREPPTLPGTHPAAWMDKSSVDFHGSVVSTRGTTITPADLSFPLPQPQGDVLEEAGSLEDMERNHIKKILRKTGGNIARAASILKISRLTLYKKIDKYRLKK